MSYDLMVFDPPAAPKSPDAFLTWFKLQTSWHQPSYNDPGATTAILYAWLVDMADKFVPMNGPLSPIDPLDYEDPLIDSDYVTDYSIGRVMIYAAFRWSVAQQAYDRMFALAGKHQLGCFDVSATPGDVWLPDGRRGLTRMFSIG